MFRLETDADSFVEALMKQEPVSLKPNGEWEYKGKLFHFLSWIPSFRRSALYANAERLIHYFDGLEAIPLYLDENGQAAKQKIPFHTLLQIGKRMESVLEHEKTHHAYALRFQLYRRVLGLSYRLEKSNGGLSPRPFLEQGNRSHLESPELFALLETAAAWKQQQTVFTSPQLTVQDIQQLHQAATYTEFVSLLLQDPSLQVSFFLWTLRDHNPSAPFIEYPALQETLTAHGLQSRIGRFEGRALRIEKRTEGGCPSLVSKHLTLLFEGKSVSLLDPTRTITFSNHYTLTIQQVYDIFKEKESQVGNIEFFYEGVCHWNANKMSRWNPRTQEYDKLTFEAGWWEQLPVFEVLQKEEVYARYGVLPERNQWILAATATRESSNLDFENTHAFFELAIPQKEEGYRIYDFGKFGIYSLSTFYQRMTGFCQTVPAVVAYPDPNVFYSHRQKMHYPFVISQEEGWRFMDLIRKDILKSRRKNFVYQVESENCAKWTYEKLVDLLGKERVPNLYRISLLETDPHGVLGTLFELVKKLPEGIQPRVIVGLHLFFGAWRGKWIIENGSRVWKSLIHHDFWRTAEVYLPALLVEQTLQGTLRLSTLEAKGARRKSVEQTISLSSSFKQVEAKRISQPLIRASAPFLSLKEFIAAKHPGHTLSTSSKILLSPFSLSRQRLREKNAEGFLCQKSSANYRELTYYYS